MALLARTMCRNNLLLRQLQPCITGRVNSASSWKEDQTKFWDKNLTGKRPISPHMTIYKFPLPALLSGTHRATGFAMTGGVIAFAAGMSVLPFIVPGDFTSYLAAVKAWQYGPILIYLTKFYITWPFTYHFMNGMRHLMWDMAIGLNMKSMYSSGYAVVGTSLVVSAMISAL